MKHVPYAAIALACALTACGGGGGNSGTTKVDITSVKVTGASLADSGTFGFKFTVQSASGTPYQVYTERIAATYGLSLCPHYTSANGGASYNTSSTCTNYAVAGAAINYGVLNTTSTFTFTPSATSKKSQVYQLQQLGAAGYSTGDLVIVGEGSSNDAANLVTAFLTDRATIGTLNTTLFGQVIGNITALDGGSSISGASVTASDGGAAAGVAYMTRLAQALVSTVKTNTTDLGARRVVVLNMLDVTRTPKLQAVLATMNATQAATVQGLVQAWVRAYNTALNTAVAAYADKMVVVDLYQGFNDELDDLAQYGLSNKTSTVCYETFAAQGYTKSGSTPAAPGTIGLGDTDITGYPTTNVPAACTDAYASSMTSHAGGADWWKTYLFADNFHPTPYGHQLLGQLVAKRLTEAGWL